VNIFAPNSAYLLVHNCAQIRCFMLCLPEVH